MMNFCRRTAILSLLFFLSCFSTTPHLHANPDPKEQLRKIFEAGINAYNQGDFHKAVEFFEISLKIYPLAQAHNYIGLSKKAMGGDLKDITWQFKKAVELDPDYAEAHDNLGKIYYSTGDFDESIKHSQIALDLNPESLSARLSLAWTYLLGKSQPNLAIPHFEYVVQRTQAAYSYFGLGTAYIMGHQKFRSLEMVTMLRKIHEESLAQQLEKMIHEGDFVAVMGPNSPLLVPASQSHIIEQAATMREPAENPVLNDSHKDIKVRLQKPASNRSSIPQLMTDDTLSGEARIKALQRRQAIPPEGGGSEYEPYP